MEIYRIDEITPRHDGSYELSLSKVQGMKSDLFHKVDDAFAILSGKDGTFRQAQIYEWQGGLFAQFGGGFIRLYDRNGTSKPSVSWREIVGTVWVVGKYGHLMR